MDQFVRSKIEKHRVDFTNIYDMLLRIAFWFSSANCSKAKILQFLQKFQSKEFSVGFDPTSHEVCVGLHANGKKIKINVDFCEWSNQNKLNFGEFLDKSENSGRRVNV